MKLTIFILLTIRNFANCQSNGNEYEGMSFIALAAESFPVCPEDGFIRMTREKGKAPSIENYWNGTFYLTKFKDLCDTRAGIELTLDNPAVLTIDPEEAEIHYANGTTFKIVIYDINNDFSLVVQGFQDKGFPNVVKVILNDRQVCKNPNKIEPFLSGSIPVALSGFDIAPEDFVPFCGRSQVEHVELILNAKETKPGDWPWHVALYSIDSKNNSARSYRCGGTIISYKSIVTAAHCVIKSNGMSVSVDQLLVIAGKFHLNENDPTVQELAVSEIVIHNEYNPNTLKNDIAVVHLKDNIQINKYVQSICLWNDYDSDRNASKLFIYGTNGTIVGWGLNENDTLSQRLGYGKIAIISDYTCIASFPAFYQRFINENSFCAGNVNSTNPCNGDSGGGLVMPIRQVDNKFSYFLRGIVSISVSRIRSGKKVCDPNYYTVFTDAARYANWLDENKFKN